MEDEHPTFRVIRNRADLDAVTGSWEAQPPAQRRVGLVFLMEGADPIRAPDEVQHWHERGVRLIGPAWRRTRYCGGTGDPGALTCAGEALLEHMAACGIILDVSHMSDRNFEQALEHYDGIVIASHANLRCAADLNTPERALSDDQIRKLAARDGVIGVIPYN
jgi:membrane dipeptidase